VHNTLKTGDRVEILSPDYVIMKMKLKEMISTKTGKKVKVAHGGGSEDVVLFEANKAVPEYSVVRRKIYNT